jgi:hypothetical protein
MRRIILYISAMSLIGSAIAAGCSGAEDSNPGSAKEVPLSELHTTIAMELCARLFRCCDAAELKSIFSSLDTLPTTQAECEAAEAPFIVPLIEEKKSAIEAGRLAYHPDLAGACYEKLRAVTCAEFRGEIDQPPVVAECETMFEGKVALGDKCAANPECAGTDATCSGADAGGTEPIGACVKKPSEGEACINFVCAEGHVCEGGTCKKLKDDGAPCEGPQQCASGLCSPIQVCMAKRANGEACDSDSVCVSGECSSAKKCAPFASGTCDGV